MLGLLVPFVVYNLALKAASVLSRSNDPGIAGILDLMKSDIFFNLGYALLWIGLFAAARRGPLRWVVVFLFHVVTVLVVIISTIAHQYLRETGTTLDYGTIAEWILKFNEVMPILTRDVPISAWILLLVALFYVTLGPWLVTLAVERWRGRRQWSPAVPAATSFLGSLGFFLLALAFGSFSTMVGPGQAGADASIARDQFVNFVLTGVEEVVAEEDYLGTDAPVEHPAAHASLAPTSQTQKRNVVLIHLESTRAQSVTPYNPELKNTPFLDQLAKSSLLVERAYTIVPRSSKASVSVNCGVDPPLYPGPEFEPGGIPVPCLAKLLNDQGYRTVFFASTLNSMDNFGDVAKGFGYEEVYPAETMDTGDFQVTNTFGYEDDIMLKPSEEWLEENGNEPFMAEYFTGTGHYGYECLGTRHGSEDFAEDDQLNRYLNCLRLQDIFLKNLFDQYEKLGLYDNTIFVIYGDHGEGFNEHGRSMHGDTIYEEGLKIPLIIHAPGWFENGERAEGLSNQTDILPTVVEMLGYEVKNGKYPGYSLLHPLPEDRTLFFSCISNRKCLASIKGHEKYIYHYGNQPEEVFDLSNDPLEKQNLADEGGDLAAFVREEEIDRRRGELLAWRSRVNAEYGSAQNLR